MEEKIPTTPNGQSMYVIIKDGNNQEYKVVNFDNPEMVQTKGLKIVRAIKRSSRHQPASVTRLERDPVNGIIYGIPAGISDISKNLKFQAIEMNDYHEFDLSVLQDRKRWAVISRAKFLVGSPYQKGRPTHELYDVEAEAVKKVKTVGDKKAAYSVIEGLSHVQIIDMARNCGGINVKNNSIGVITGELYDFIDSKEKGKGAVEFNRIWLASNRDSLTVFKRCEAVGLIHFDIAAGGFLWKRATMLGTTEPQSIEYITNNTSLLMAMDNESKSMDPEYQKTATPEEKNTFITPGPIHKNVDNEILKRQEAAVENLEAKTRELDELMSKMRGAQAVNLNDTIPTAGATPEQKQELSDLDAVRLKELQVLARNKHKMVHAYTVKDIEKVQKWIDDHPEQV